MDTMCARLVNSMLGRPKQHVIALLIPLNARSVPIDCHADDEHQLCADLSEVARI
jgi:hypothetical protein